MAPPNTPLLLLNTTLPSKMAEDELLSSRAVPKLESNMVTPSPPNLPIAVSTDMAPIEL